MADLEDQSTLENTLAPGSDTNNNRGKERDVEIFPRAGRATINTPPPSPINPQAGQYDAHNTTSTFLEVHAALNTALVPASAGAALYECLELPRKFDGTNFGVWKRGMVNTLKSRGLLELVTGVEREPSDITLRPIYQCCECQASTLISACIDDATFTFLEDVRYQPQVMWARLLHRYSAVNPLMNHLNFERFNNITHHDGESLHDYFAKLRSVAAQLPSGFVTQEYLIHKTLKGLPASFTPIVVMLQEEVDIE